MSDDEEDVTLWQKVKGRRYTGLEKRAPNPVNYLAWVPLGVAVMTGGAGYVKMQAKVVELEKNQARIESTITKELDKAEEMHAAIWRRISGG